MYQTLSPSGPFSGTSASHVNLDFLYMAVFERDTKEITQQHDFNQANRIDCGSVLIRTVQMGDCITDKGEVDGGISFTCQMVLREQLFEGNHFKLILLGERAL